MRKVLAIIIACAFGCANLCAEEVTIEECVSKAEANYPLVKKYGLLTLTCDINLSDINKSWYPRAEVYGQLTAQNVVPAFPKSLSGVLEQMGQDMKGLGKLQYKVGVDVSQTIWDGGVSSARREVVRKQTETQKAATDVELYSVRQRVENLYFAILLTEKQVEQSLVTYNLLLNNLERLRSMFRNGTAMQSDVDMVEAQALTVNQNIEHARSAAEGYRQVLEAFMGESLAGKTLGMPEGHQPLTSESARPELRLFARQFAENQAQYRLSNTSMLPRIGLFAQAYYGYPGFDYFQSMLNRGLSFNIMAGVKVSWSLDSFYTKKNISRKRDITAENIAVERDIFLFNSNLQAVSQKETIRGLRTVMKDDARIVELRAGVRRAAESQLANGIIDATALLTKISDENIAKLTASLHEIQLLQEIYKLRYILNQ